MPIEALLQVFEQTHQGRAFGENFKELVCPRPEAGEEAALEDLPGLKVRNEHREYKQAPPKRLGEDAFVVEFLVQDLTEARRRRPALLVARASDDEASSPRFRVCAWAARRLSTTRLTL